MRRVVVFLSVTALLTCSLTGLGIVPSARAMEVGGKLDVSVSAQLQDDGSFDTEVVESLDLELFLPPLGNNTEMRVGFLLTKPIQGLFAGNEPTYFAKKLYLRHRGERFHLTVGRQPVSWSFGSLLNLVDYTLGAETLKEDSTGKYIDAIGVYIPVNWNSGVDAVLSFPRGFSTETKEMKWGVRGRFGVRRYDLTVSYVRESEAAAGGGSGDLMSLASLFPRQRLGLTLKGDVGNFGVYGALGYYFDTGVDSSRSYLVGVDYSRSIDYYRKLTLQLEYLGIQPGNLDPTVKANLLNLDGDDHQLDLLTASVVYPIDDFSSVSLVTVVSLDDGSFLAAPVYRNALPGDIDLTVGVTAFFGRDGSLLAPGVFVPKVVFTVGLSYAF